VANGPRIGVVAHSPRSWPGVAAASSIHASWYGDGTMNGAVQVEGGGGGGVIIVEDCVGVIVGVCTGDGSAVSLPPRVSQARGIDATSMANLCTA
jgi:hypothetical protein